MKKIKMVITGLAVFVMVGVTLALKPSTQGQGSVYCIYGPVIPSKSCASQGSILIDAQIVGTGGSTENPCVAAGVGGNPYNTGATACTSPGPGTQYQTTLP